jgi:putative two-component system response regulator
VISATRLPNVNGILFVHQSEASTRIGVQKILTPLGYAGVFIGAILILVSTKLSTRIVSSYENQLEEVNSGLEETVKRRTDSLMRTKNAVIFGLAKLAESRDSDTGEHLERISLYSTHLARAHSKKTTEITPECIESIGLASSLHDIGKVGVPDRVLLKPGKLTPEERIEIQAHAQIGEACLQAIDEKLQSDRFLFLAKEIAAFHHEKWDGSGYPYSLKREEIPISARIVAVADVYDALRSKRPYKNPLSHTEACKILAEGACTHFDPDIIDSFISVNREFEAISNSNLNPEEPEKAHESPPLLIPRRLIDQTAVLVST